MTSSKAHATGTLAYIHGILIFLYSPAAASGARRWWNTGIRAHGSAPCRAISRLSTTAEALFQLLYAPSQGFILALYDFEL